MSYLIPAFAVVCLVLLLLAIIATGNDARPGGQAMMDDKLMDRRAAEWNLIRYADESNERLYARIKEAERANMENADTRL